MAAAVVRMSALSGSAARPTKSKKSERDRPWRSAAGGGLVQGAQPVGGPDGTPAVQLVEGADVGLDASSGRRASWAVKAA